MHDDNTIYSGCTITPELSATLVAETKAISEGFGIFNAICLWAEDKEPEIDFIALGRLIAIAPRCKLVLAHGDKYRIVPQSEIESVAKQRNYGKEPGWLIKILKAKYC